MSSTKLEEGDKLMAKAAKATTPSLLSFRFSPDWEAAAPFFGQAAQCYRVAGNFEKAVEAFQKAAAAHASQGMLWQAGKDMEAAADFSKQRKNWELAHTCYWEAANLYMSGGRHTAGADCLAKGAQALEEAKPAEAMAMLEAALEVYDTEAKGLQALDVYRQAIGTAILLQRYQQSAALQMTMAALCIAGGARMSGTKAYLGAVVTLLFACDGEGSWRCYQGAMAQAEFACSEEGAMAQALVDAFRTGDELVVKKTVQSSKCLRFLDNKVARLAVCLPQGSVKSVASGLNAAAGGPANEAHRVSAAGVPGGPSFAGSMLQYGMAGSTPPGVAGSDGDEELL